jgi:UDP-GlcNAc:undecaprenyl-phosphate GlcNAc-1-phosphate transferase
MLYRGSMAHLTELDALYAFLVAATITALLTPLTMRLARTVGAIDRPRERGLSDRPMPLLGGLAIYGGALAAGLIWLPQSGVEGRQWHGVLVAATVITAVGALDDRFELPVAVKLAGQVGAALIAVDAGVVVHLITLPFLGALHFPNAGGAITVVGLVALMNVVNFSDGVDGLAAGVCAIIALAFGLIAIDLFHGGHLHSLAPAVFAGLTAGAALGFLVHNFPPASSFMGDCGSNLLGLLMGCLTVQAAVKTQVVISFVLPLILLTVPFLDTTFVVLKRLKYRRPIYEPDSEHFHHRMARIGFSPRRTIAYLYAWTLLLAGLALALRFVPYSDHHGHLHTGWALVMIALGLLVAAASVYLVYVLEILKFSRLEVLGRRAMSRRAEQGTGERQVDQQRVGAEDEHGRAQAAAGADGGQR